MSGLYEKKRLERRVAHYVHMTSLEVVRPRSSIASHWAVVFIGAFPDARDRDTAQISGRPSSLESVRPEVDDATRWLLGLELVS